jgi:hypothetical protein
MARCVVAHLKPVREHSDEAGAPDWRASTINKDMCMKKLTVCALAGILGVGCGGGGGGGIDEGPSAKEGTANPAAMKAGVMQTQGLRTAVEGGNGDTMAGSALSLSSSAMGAVTPKGTASAEVEDQMIKLVNADTGTTGTKTCNEMGCTFTNYGTGQFTINGSLTATDAGGGVKKVVWDLDGSGTASGAQTGGLPGIDYTYNWNGDLTVSATAVDGAAGGVWGGKGSVQGQSFNYDYGSVMKFQNVSLQDGCATGGSVFAKWWIVVNAGGQKQSQAHQATQTFTACQ